MKQTIRLQDIYSADLYTRSRASELRKCINDDADEVTLDFEGIGFMSRSLIIPSQRPCGGIFYGAAPH